MTLPLLEHIEQAVRAITSIHLNYWLRSLLILVFNALKSKLLRIPVSWGLFPSSTSFPICLDFGTSVSQQCEQLPLKHTPFLSSGLCISLVLPTSQCLSVMDKGWQGLHPALFRAVPPTLNRNIYKKSEHISEILCLG